MDIINLENNSIALSTSYEADSDIKFLSYHNISEEGLNFYKENYLRNAVDRRINNYSSVYLTNKQKLDNIIEIQQLSGSNKIETFNTSLIDNKGLYLTLTSLTGDCIPYYFTEKDQKFIDFSDRIFEINLINEFDAKISHKTKNRKIYYLTCDGYSVNFCLCADGFNSLFKYILDKENNKLALFKESKIDNTIYSINVINDILILNPDLSSFTDNNFTINYYIQKLTPKINTSWISYNPSHKNSYEINPLKSRSDLENNYLISNQYSYIEGNTLKSNILTLKNQTTHKNYNYRSDYIEMNNDGVPLVNVREYYGLNTGNEQEKGDYGITLSYEFYNSDYKFVSDSYTTFITPDSLYPYKQININDLGWDKMGSIGGENPYVSDRIYQKIMTDDDSGSEYLCSWLYKNNKGENIWLDRYYYPIKTSYSSALKTSFNYSFDDPSLNLFMGKLSTQEYYDVPFPYNSLEEEYEVTPQTIKSATYGRSFYDKRSDLVILPNKEYIYFRVGNKYVKEIIKTIENILLQNGLVAKNSNDSTITMYISAKDNDEIEYVLDNNTYASIDNYTEINNSHEFTLAFWLKSNDWSTKNGYSLIGNLNHKGFSLLNDRKITPFITLQKDNKVFIYNTNFEMLDMASLDSEYRISETKIKDIYRTDHLDQFYTINIQ